MNKALKWTIAPIVALSLLGLWAPSAQAAEPERSGDSDCVHWDTWREKPLDGKDPHSQNTWWARVTNNCGSDVDVRIYVENALCNVGPFTTVAPGQTHISYSTCWTNGASWARVEKK